VRVRRPFEEVVFVACFARVVPRGHLGAAVARRAPAGDGPAARRSLADLLDAGRILRAAAPDRWARCSRDLEERIAGQRGDVSQRPRRRGPRARGRRRSGPAGGSRRLDPYQLHRVRPFTEVIAGPRGRPAGVSSSARRWPSGARVAVRAVAGASSPPPAARFWRRWRPTSGRGRTTLRPAATGVRKPRRERPRHRRVRRRTANPALTAAGSDSSGKEPCSLPHASGPTGSRVVVTLARSRRGGPRVCGARSEPDRERHGAGPSPGLDAGGRPRCARRARLARRGAWPVSGPVWRRGNLRQRRRTTTAATAIEEGCARARPARLQPCFSGPPGGATWARAATGGARTCGMNGTLGRVHGRHRPARGTCVQRGRTTSANGLLANSATAPILCPFAGATRACSTGAPVSGPTRLRGRGFLHGPRALVGSGRLRGRPVRRASRPTRPQLRPAQTPRTADATLFPAGLSGRLHGDARRGHGRRADPVVQRGSRTSRARACAWRCATPRARRTNLDLFMHDPAPNRDPWYAAGGTSFQALPNSCGWHNCEATDPRDGHDDQPAAAAGELGLRQQPGCPSARTAPQGRRVGRAAWASGAKPAGSTLITTFAMATGRAGEHQHRQSGRRADRFRIMVAELHGAASRGRWSTLYCSGRRTATYGEPPNEGAALPGRLGQQRDRRDVARG